MSITIFLTPPLHRHVRGRFLEGVFPHLGIVERGQNLAAHNLGAEAFVQALHDFDGMPRIRHIHLKDVRMKVRDRVKAENMSFLDGVRAGMFTVPGDGDVDFEPIFDIVGKSSYDGWYIVEAEQDPAKANPLEYAQKARAYIRAKAHL